MGHSKRCRRFRLAQLYLSPYAYACDGPSNLTWLFSGYTAHGRLARRPSYDTRRRPRRPPGGPCQCCGLQDITDVHHHWQHPASPAQPAPPDHCADAPQAAHALSHRQASLVYAYVHSDARARNSRAISGQRRSSRFRFDYSGTPGVFCASDASDHVHGRPAAERPAQEGARTASWVEKQEDPRDISGQQARVHIGYCGLSLRRDRRTLEEEEGKTSKRPPP